MKTAFIYQDEKSNKFWAIDYNETELCVHYGKVGAIGKYEIKEFDTEEDCIKEAQKLIASKKKKGYAEYETFNFEECIYIDDMEYGLNIKTSHPRFVKHFTEKFYYDCTDEESPFGSDTGSDTLSSIEEKLRGKKDFDFSTYPKWVVEIEFDMNYIPAELEDMHKIKAITDITNDEQDMLDSDRVTYATAFAQIKTTGKLNSDLKQMALNSLKRHAIMMDKNGEFGGKLTETQQQMYDDLLSFE